MPPLEELLADHEMLVAALGTPSFWNRELATLRGSREVAAVHVSPVGTGQVASCSRVSFDFGDDPHASGSNGGPGPPASVVVKTASADPTSRTTSAALRHGEIEVGFYSIMASACAARTPQCHLAALSPSGDDFILVLEDLERFTQADQILGMDPDDVADAVDELAALHATWWDSVPHGSESFLVDRGDPSAHAVLLSMLHPGFVERYGANLDPVVLDAAERLIHHAAAYLTTRPGPTAVTHGDFRPDNLLIAPPEAASNDHGSSTRTSLDDSRVAVVDWQTVTVGPALADLSYFLGGAMTSELRAAHEAELLERYRARLGESGIDLPSDEVAAGYRRFALDGLVMAIGASQVVGRTDRGDQMFSAMAERSALHALECGTFELLG